MPTNFEDTFPPLFTNLKTAIYCPVCQLVDEFHHVAPDHA